MAATAAAARRALARVSRTLASGGGYVRLLSGRNAGSEKTLSHTDKWMSPNSDKESPMVLVNEIPPIPIKGRIVTCRGDPDPAQAHPIQYICLDLPVPAVCKYCGLRYISSDK